MILVIAAPLLWTSCFFYGSGPKNSPWWTRKVINYWLSIKYDFSQIVLWHVCPLKNICIFTWIKSPPLTKNDNRHCKKKVQFLASVDCNLWVVIFCKYVQWWPKNVKRLLFFSIKRLLFVFLLRASKLTQ